MDLERTFDALFPLMRSITGDGYRRSLEILRTHVPFEIHSVASGTKVFDWTVPPEWIFRSARLTGPDGAVVADAARSSLEVLNYSEPVDAEIDLDDLQDHLYSLPTLPDATPYVTSYYERRWGFCLPHRVREALPQGKYRAHIDADFDGNGAVEIGEAVLAGESEREFLLSSYLCHPSLANNELSGPLVLAGLYNRIKGWPRRRFTYRFVINPETIGALCYLHLFGARMRERLAGALVLTCLGGPEKTLSFKGSRAGASFLDKLVDHLARRAGAAVRHRRFTPVGGSDERQYCSPGFDLPVLQVGRTLYGEYPGYHNSLDTKAFMDIDAIKASIDELEAFLKLAEASATYVNLSPFGEPQLGKRNLYPSESWVPSYAPRAADSARALLPAILHLLNFCDGTRPLVDLCEQEGFAIEDLVAPLEILERERLLGLA